MIYLTKNEELEILNEALKNKDNYLGNGSSRAVYEITYRGKKAALKVFLDEGGKNQSDLEVKFFLSHRDLTSEFYAVGKNCIVCELINMKYSEVVSEIYEQDLGYNAIEEFCDTDLTKEQYNNIISLFDELDDIYYSDDNYQIGWSDERECFVSYDFGYQDFNGELIGHMESYICDYGDRWVLQEAIRMVENDIEFKGRCDLDEIR